MTLSSETKKMPKKLALLKINAEKITPLTIQQANEVG